MRHPKPGTQPDKVLQALLAADGDWVNKQYLIRNLGLTQAGARLFELENDYGWPIEHSDFTDEWGFKSYRIKAEEPATLPLIPTSFVQVKVTMKGYETYRHQEKDPTQSQEGLHCHQPEHR